MTSGAGNGEFGWGFANPQDAAGYLTELARLWGVWIAGLVVLMTNSGMVLIVGGIAVIALLLWFARPLQRRAEALVPDDSAYERGPILGKGTTRDRALRAFAYGDEPLRQAVELAERSGMWLIARRGMLGVTIAVFAVVVIQTFGA